MSQPGTFDLAHHAETTPRAISKSVARATGGADVWPPATDAPAPMVAPPVADGGGLRYNEGKNKVELIPPEWPWALGMVLTRGAIKYADRNWERGMSWAYMVGSILRHLLKFMCGERYDKESGNHHMAHAAWNCLGLMSYDLRGLQKFNDLPSCSLTPPEPGQSILDLTATEMGPELRAMLIKKLTAR